MKPWDGCKLCKGEGVLPMGYEDRNGEFNYRNEECPCAEAHYAGLGKALAVDPIEPTNKLGTYRKRHWEDGAIAKERAIRALMVGYE